MNDLMIDFNKLRLNHVNNDIIKLFKNLNINERTCIALHPNKKKCDVICFNESLFCKYHSQSINSYCQVCKYEHKFQWEHYGHCTKYLLHEVDDLNGWIERGKDHQVYQYFPNWRENIIFIMSQNKDNIKLALDNINIYLVKNNECIISILFFKELMEEILGIS